MARLQLLTGNYGGGWEVPGVLNHPWSLLYIHFRGKWKTLTSFDISFYVTKSVSLQPFKLKLKSNLQ